MFSHFPLNGRNPMLSVEGGKVNTDIGRDTMDTKTNERVLRTIFDIKKSDVLSRPVPKLLEKLPDLTKEEIESSIEDLAKLEHLEMHAGDEIFHILVKPSAIGYLREIEEKRINESVQKWETRRWNLFQTAFGVILGALLTIIVQHVIK